MVDFTFSEEQRLLKEQADRYVRDEYTFERRRAAVATDDGFDRERWRTFADLGWLALPLPEAHGGLNGSAVDVMVLMESFGRGLVVEPYMPTVILGAGLVAAGACKELCNEVLPAVATGEMLLAFAQVEPKSRFNLNHVETQAGADGAGYRLAGHKGVVGHGGSADKYVVSARTGGNAADRDGITLFLVDRQADGISVRDYRTIDGHRAAEVTFDKVRVGAEHVIGEVGRGLPLIETAVDRAIVAMCAEGVGIMDALREATLEYLGTREQFGQPLGRFQALQHRAVDMFVACEELRSMTMMASAVVANGGAEAVRAVSAAKVHLGQGGRLVGEEAVQMHGGMGVTDELIVGHYFKRLTMLNVAFGNVDHHLARFAALESNDEEGR